MPRLSKEAEKLLQEYGYILSHQKGSHRKRRKGEDSIIIPNHKELKPGTASSILTDFCTQNNKDRKDIIKQYNIQF